MFHENLGKQDDNLSKAGYRNGVENSVDARYDSENEKYAENLKGLLKSVSKEINGEHGPGLINKDGTVRMNAFSLEDGGPYSKKKIKNDEGGIDEITRVWSGEEEKTPEQYKSDREKKLGSLWEMAVTAILNKILKSDFLVVRASKFDDYNHGVDTIIVDKGTGNVICAFDEISAEKESEASRKKSEKIEKRNLEGGAVIEYGITFKEGKLIKKAIKNVPEFFLQLSGDELMDILQKMNFDSLEKISGAELELFDKLMISLEEQTEKLRSAQGLMPFLKEKLDSFKSSLGKMTEIRNKKFRKDGVVARNF